MRALDPFDAVPAALSGISAATWIWLASKWFKTRKTQAIQLPIDDSQSVSSSNTNLDKLEDKDIPIEIEKWTRRVNRRKVAYAMSALASIGCNIVALCTAQTVGWRNIFWLCYWINLLILATIWRLTTPTNTHWPMTAILACLPLIMLTETIASILLRPTAGLYEQTLHEILPGLWTSACLVMATMVERAPPYIVQSPYTYKNLTSAGDKVLPRASSSLVSFILFSWMRPTLDTANRGDDDGEYPSMPNSVRAYALHEAWKESCAASLPKNENPAPGDIDMGRSPFPRIIGRLQWRILVCNARTSIVGACMECVLACLRYGPAWSVKHFLEVFEESGRGAVSRRLAWAWLLMIVASMLGRALVQAQTYANWNCTNTPSIRAHLNGALYQKTLRLRDQVETEASDVSKTSKRRANIMSLFSTDTQRAAEAVNRWVELLACRPLELAVSGCLLYGTLGTSGFVGILVPLALVPVTQYAVRKLGRDQAVLMRATDARLSITNEMLQSIKFIKFMAFEKVCEDRILAAREDELAALRRLLNDKVCIDTMGVAGPMLSLFVAFAVYTKVEQKVLTASIAFSSILIMEQLRYALASMMSTTFTIIQARNALTRLESYLEQDSLDHIKTDVLASDSDSLHKRTRTAHAQTAHVTLKNATFAWSSAHAGFRLSQVSATFGEGINLVCGQISAGKTLLLRGLLGEADLVDGQSSVETAVQKLDGDWLDGSIAYAPQAPWLLNGSIRDNILFGLPLLEPRYSEAIAACGLSPDLLILEDGDLTEIGEKGVILSGGQKARVSLARAIYSRASIVLLDDPLSAVDSHTGKHIFNECLCGPLASDRTILLVSHALYLCAPAAIQVMHLDAGRVAFCGSGDDYLKTELYSAAINQNDDGHSRSESEEADARSDTLVDTSSKSPESIQTAVASSASQKRAVTQVVKAETKTKAGSELSIWLYWLELNGGINFAICILAVFLGGKGMWLLRDRWVGVWTDRNALSENPLEDANFYIAITGLLSLATICVLAARFPVTFIGSRRVSRKLYRDMVHAVLRSPMRFFDTALLGSLLNRFGRDVEVIDVDLAPSAGDVLNSICGYTMVVATVGMVSPLMAVTMLPLLTLAYFHFGRFFLAASSELRKLDALHKSPLFGLYSETNAGLNVIRAYKRAPQFMLSFLQRLDQAQLFYVLTWYANRWLAVRFDLVSTAFTILVGLAVLLSPSSLVSPGFAGFAIYVTIRASGDVFWITRHLTSTQMGLTSVERCKEYSELPAEAPGVVEPRPSAAWPVSGTIEVKNLSVRYAPGLPKVLKNVSFAVRGGEKVGIVGATGSGKTTLSIALFRFVEADEGAILVDGLDIAKIGVSDLRSQLCIVPQDPTVLSGTLRSTLDPLKVGYSDKEMYDALKSVHLIRDGQDTPEEGAVSQHQQFFRNLDSHISEQGKNLSSGEKQLVCMARAILKRSKIVICDEATSSLDHQTDRLVTQTLSEGFEGSTMLVIAHRLRTVIEFNKILVMHEGTVAEYDTPANLLSDSNSRFYALCQATGPQEFASLQQICGAQRA